MNEPSRLCAPAVVEVYHIAVGDSAPEPLALTAVLTTAEREQAARYRQPADRRRFAGARGALRVLLGARLGLPAREVPLQRSPDGKPELPGTLTPRCHFSVTHSGDVALVALCADAEVGVDVEWMRPLADALPLAERFFSAREAATMQAASSGGEQRRVFYRLWTRKEAVLKATGQGIGRGLAGVEVSAHDQAAVLAVNGEASAPSQWTLWELNPAPGHLGAVAVHCPGATLVNRPFDANIAP